MDFNNHKAKNKMWGVVIVSFKVLFFLFFVSHPNIFQNVFPQPILSIKIAYSIKWICDTQYFNNLYFISPCRE